MAPHLGNRHWDLARPAHLCGPDGGRIDLTTENPGDGKLGGEWDLFPFTGPPGFSCIDRMEWSAGNLRGCGVQRERGGQAGKETPETNNSHVCEWEGRGRDALASRSTNKVSEPRGLSKHD